MTSSTRRVPTHLTAPDLDLTVRTMEPNSPGLLSALVSVVYRGPTGVQARTLSFTVPEAGPTSIADRLLDEARLQLTWLNRIERMWFSLQ